MIEHGANNTTRDLDLLRVIRAKRMHGFGINFSIDNSLRDNAARLALSRPLRDFTESAIEEAKQAKAKQKFADSWADLEGLNKADYFMLAFFKRYSMLLFGHSREEEKKPDPKKKA